MNWSAFANENDLQDAPRGTMKRGAMVGGNARKEHIDHRVGTGCPNVCRGEGEAMTIRHPIIPIQKPADENRSRGSIPLALLTLLLAMPVRAETDFCAGKRLGFVLTYCHPRNSACLNQRVDCRRSHGTFQQGFNEGRWLAQNRVQLEIKLIAEMIRKQRQEKER